MRCGDFSKGFDHGIVFIDVAGGRGRHGAGGDPHLLPGLVQNFSDIGRDVPAAGGVKSYFKLPPTFTRSGGAPAIV